MKSVSTTAIVSILVVSLAGCSGGTSTDDVQSGTDATTDAVVAADTRLPDDTGLMFEAFVPCNAPENYVLGSTVTFDNSLTYTPQCIAIHRGSTVTFNGSFVEHPLRPSTRGTANNPITATATGASATFTFNETGFFPYFCLLHGADVGAGMSGVVQVIP